MSGPKVRTDGRDGFGRFICTAETPWSTAIGGKAVHRDAEDVGECADGCCDKYLCRHCGTRFTVEHGA